MPLDPRNITVENSLNRVKIMDLPGHELPAAVKGRSAYDLISTQALNRLIDAQHETLGLLPDTDDVTARAYFRVLLSAGDPTAEAIARELGRNLGYLLLTLHRGDAVNRSARHEWNESHWTHWRAIRHVFMAGGMMAGKTGEVIRQTALSLIHDELPDYRIEVAIHPPHLALIGAARFVTRELTTHVFDFGSSYVKRAGVQYGSYGLERLHILDRIPINIGVDARREDAQRIFNRMITTIAETCDETTTGLVPVSIAAYVDEHGQPLLTQKGIYMHLSYLSDDVEGMMSEVLSKRVGRPLEVRLLHDGTAAATVYAGTPNAAVIVLGSSLGVGFPVPRENLRPVAPNLNVIDARTGHSIGL